MKKILLTCILIIPISMITTSFIFDFLNINVRINETTYMFSIVTFLFGYKSGKEENEEA